MILMYHSKDHMIRSFMSIQDDTVGCSIELTLRLFCLLVLSDLIIYDIGLIYDKITQESVVDLTFSFLVLIMEQIL